MNKKLVYGVGINDSDYIISKKKTVGRDGRRLKQITVWTCPFYQSWIGMLRRCYSEIFHKKCPTYIGCSVCEEWLTFSNFKKWMETQDWGGKQLDKDILVVGNKVYSPETCCFVSQRVNKFLLDSARSRGEWPIGVCFHKGTGKFTAVVRCENKAKHLGLFHTPEEAYIVWKKAKHEVACDLAKLETDCRIKEALTKRFL